MLLLQLIWVTQNKYFENLRASMLTDKVYEVLGTALIAPVMKTVVFRKFL